MSIAISYLESNALARWIVYQVTTVGQNIDLLRDGA